ncbi:MAG: prepilin-type N-terminal cleavage/methylation domain-containing protein [Erysipelotrichaceae bacterium]|nr:prepilin-type N-terminal cleavage/methylation domain-containing protein [Erysipelotrichaceae bacterium]
MKQGFTLSELLIVVAIISILVSVSVPTFNDQIEKSREATDAANIRSAYATLMTEINSGSTSGQINVDLKQKKNNWQNIANKEGLLNLGKVTGEPKAGNKVIVKYANNEVEIYFGVPVPGDQATLDAQNFPTSSYEYKILMSLADAERQALEMYKNDPEGQQRKLVAFIVYMNTDGTYRIETDYDDETSSVYSPTKIMTPPYNKYAIAVRGDQVGSSLVYDKDTNKLTSQRYHLRTYHYQGTSYGELFTGIDWNY